MSEQEEKTIRLIPIGRMTAEVGRRLAGQSSKDELAVKRSKKSKRKNRQSKPEP